MRNAGTPCPRSRTSTLDPRDPWTDRQLSPPYLYAEEDSHVDQAREALDSRPGAQLVVVNVVQEHLHRLLQNKAAELRASQAVSQHRSRHFRNPASLPLRSSRGPAARQCPRHAFRCQTWLGSAPIELQTQHNKKKLRKSSDSSSSCSCQDIQAASY